MKRILSLACVGVAAMALAGVKTTMFAEGRGVLISEGNHTARFTLTGQKTQHGEHVGVRGQVTLEMGTNTAGRKIRITVQHFNTVENRATMAGPAVMIVREGGTVHEFRGVGEAVAVSRKHPGETGDPDTVSVHFAREGGPNFAFAGRVHEGDVTVGKSVNY